MFEELPFDDDHSELIAEWDDIDDFDDLVSAFDLEELRVSKKIKLGSNNQNSMEPKLSLSKKLKHDIRRDYVSMFVNAANSYDIPKLERFLNTYSRDNLSFNYVTSKQLLCLPNKFHTSGISPMIDYWKGFFRITPDSFINVNTLNIVKYKGNDGSIIISNARTKGTLVYYIPLEYWLPTANIGIFEDKDRSEKIEQKVLTEVQVKKKRKSKLSIKRKKGSKFFSSSVSELLHHDREIFNGKEGELLPKLKTFDIFYTVKLFLDENFYIYRCEYEVWKSIINDVTE